VNSNTNNNGTGTAMENFGPHAMAEARDLKPQDRRLRNNGWRIRARAKGKKALWEKGRRVLAEDEALAELAVVVEAAGRVSVE